VVAQKIPILPLFEGSAMVAYCLIKLKKGQIRRKPMSVQPETVYMGVILRSYAKSGTKKNLIVA
jgi:hypothetical protein